MRYTARAEYAYVTGSARVALGCTAGTRDEHHDGWTVERFQTTVNEFIRARRAERVAAHKEWANASVVAGNARQSTFLDDEFAYLTREDVIALRLYTGPACAHAPPEHEPIGPARRASCAHRSPRT